MYMGKLFSFEGMHDLDLKNRISKAWGKFGLHRAELTDRRLNLNKRTHSFKSVVQSAFLYGCVSWTLTHEREHLTQNTQRKMMRKIMGAGRCREGEPEDWVDWIVRATRAAEAARKEHNAPDWVEEVHRRRYNLARHLASCEDGKWTKQMLLWSVSGHQRRRRPLARWSDSFTRF